MAAEVEPRHRLVRWLERFVLVASALVWLVSCDSRPPHPRSLVLIVIDTLRADHLGAYGYPRPTSPGLDRWAAQGALFENALASSPWTLPSFGSIFTGRYPSAHQAGRVLKHGLFDREVAKLDGSTRTLPEILQREGFATAAIVTNAFLHPSFGVARGFESYDFFQTVRGDSRRAQEVVDRALAWLDARDERPFFLLVHFFDPHISYDPPDSTRGRFSSDYAGELTYPVYQQLQIRAGLIELDAADRRFISSAYDEEIAYLDGQLDRLLGAMANRGLFDEALVVLTADHGEELFDHDGFEHGHSQYQELLHVPLVFWGPGVVDARITAPASHVDFLPTLLDALDISAPGGLAGISLWPALRGESEPPSRALLAEGILYGAERKALLRWPFKLIEGEDGGAAQLFDLSADPRERRDLAATQIAGREALAAELSERLRVARDGAPSPERAAIDAPTREGLRALGYLAPGYLE